MQTKEILILVVASVVSCFGLMSCASLEPFSVSKAKIGSKTATNFELTSLPIPKEKIVAAVYKFRDQTGQYKSSSTASSFSTAVTQGATSILIKALEDSKWFVPIEREGLSDLLNERKIVRSSRDNYLNEDGKKLPDLPPLLYAGIILEGGIISYDTDVLTGGEGIEYFGISLSGQYRQDRITIYLRAISTQNGRILKTVYTTKTILSQLVDVGLYKYVEYSRILQAEAGFSYNEPTDICVTQAVEKAVQSLIVEGIMDGLWQLKDSTDISSSSIKNYLEEKNEIEEKDYAGREYLKKRGSFGIGLNLGGQIYSGDYSHREFNGLGEVDLKINTWQDLFLNISYSRGILSAKNSFSSVFHSLEISGSYYLLPGFDLSPFLIFGGGLLIREDSKKSKTYPITLSYSNFPSFVWGAGIEYLFSDNIGLGLELTNHYILSDQVDGLSNGKFFDYFWKGGFGINIYF
ncbi:MAG: curli production assembly/transport component CsgG [Bacteroidetes bacterium]|nr:curli production assembly/transport component CsgG [Bacteroidota bacterium]